MALRKEVTPAGPAEEMAEADEQYLGEATLAKLRAGLEFEDAATFEDESEEE
jgi:hypothetical protein